MERMDVYERKPAGMENYLSHYGWHFSKKMAEWAISMMRDKNGAKVATAEKETIEEAMKANNIKIDTIKGYDAVYVLAMARADYFGSSLTSDVQLYKFVGDYLNDKDGYDGIAFTRFYADCLAKGDPILWEEML
jgi:hypothetical protein